MEYGETLSIVKPIGFTIGKSIDGFFFFVNGNYVFFSPEFAKYLKIRIKLGFIHDLKLTRSHKIIRI